MNEEQEKDKFICEKLDWKCSSPISIMGGLMWEYPDFTSEAGRVQLLKLAKEHENFYRLIERMANPDNFILFLTDDTGKFRDAVFRWLGGKG